MAEFAGQTRRSPHKLAVQNHAHADAFGNRNRNEIAGAIRVMPEPKFRQGAGICLVFQVHSQSGRLFQPFL